MRPKTILVVLSLLVGVVLVGAGPASALPMPDTTVSEVKLVGAGSLTDWISIAGEEGTVVLGPYSLKVPSTDVALAWMCFDAAPTMSLNQTWPAYLTSNAATAADLWFHGDAYGEQKIHMISWLAYQWDGKSAAQLGAINEAIWEISADYAGTTSLDLGTGSFRTSSGSPYSTLATGFFTDALDHKDSNYGQGLFLIPLKDVTQGVDWNNVDHTIQPFVTAVPEPGTLLLLGSGLIGVAALASRHNPRRPLISPRA
jgi:hypothetical protein